MKVCLFSIHFLFIIIESAFYQKVIWSSPVAQMVKNVPAMQETQVQSMGQKDPLEKEGMATHSSTLSWRIPWTEEPGGVWSIGLQRVEHYWSTLHTCVDQRNRTENQDINPCVVNQHCPAISSFRSSHPQCFDWGHLVVFLSQWLRSQLEAEVQGTFIPHRIYLTGRFCSRAPCWVSSLVVRLLFDGFPAQSFSLTVS